MGKNNQFGHQSRLCDQQISEPFAVSSETKEENRTLDNRTKSKRCYNEKRLNTYCFLRRS